MFEVLGQIFENLVARPFFNFLLFFAQKVPPYDLGFSILYLTLILKILFFPLERKIQKNHLEVQEKIKKFQKEFKEIQKKYKNDLQKLQEETIKLAKTHKISFSSLFNPLMLIPFIILVALYRSFRLIKDFPNLPETGFFGIFNLHADCITSPSGFCLAVLVGFSQFFYFASEKNIPKGNSPEEKMQRMMIYYMRVFFPFLIFFISLKLPTALVLYWFFWNIFSILEKKWFLRFSFEKK